MSETVYTNEFPSLVLLKAAFRVFVLKSNVVVFKELSPSRDHLTGPLQLTTEGLSSQLEKSSIIGDCQAKAPERPRHYTVATEMI
eukprot:5932834-Amphidinium_carterae.1